MGGVVDCAVKLSTKLLVIGEVGLLGPSGVGCAVHLRGQAVVVGQLVLHASNLRAALRAPALLHGSSAVADRVDVS